MLRRRRKLGLQPAGVRATLVDPEPRLGGQVVAAPPNAVVFQYAAQPVVGHRTMLETDSAACAKAGVEERAELMGAAVRATGPDGLAEVPICREGAHDRIGVAGVERGVVATHDATEVGVSGLEYGGPDVAPSKDWQLAEVVAEHHRPIVGGFGHHRHRPSYFPLVPDQVDQPLHHGPPADDRRRHGLGTGVAFRQQELAAADELPKALVATDLARAGVGDDHPRRATRPPGRGCHRCSGRRRTAPPDQPDPRHESAVWPAPRHW